MDDPTNEEILKRLSGMDRESLLKAWHAVARTPAARKLARQQRAARAAVTDLLKDSPRPTDLEWAELARKLRDEGVYSITTYVLDIAMALKKMSAKL